MSNYYYNPITTELISFDREAMRLLILEKVDLSGTIKEPTAPPLSKEKPKKKAKPRGRGGRAGLSLETINRIKEMKNRGALVREIATELNLGMSTVSKYLYTNKKVTPEKKDGPWVDPNKIEDEED